MKHFYSLLIALCLPLSLSAGQPSYVDQDLKSKKIGKAICNTVGIFTALPSGYFAGLAAGMVAAYNPESTSGLFVCGLAGGAASATISPFSAKGGIPMHFNLKWGAVGGALGYLCGLLGGLVLKGTTSVIRT